MSRLGRIGRGVRALSPAEWVALIQAAVTIPLVVLSLRVSGLRRTQSRLAKINRLKLPPTIDFEAARRFARIVNIAGNYGLRQPNCLQRSLVLWAILRRHQVDAQLRIGVAPPQGDDGLLFHAWLELGNEVINARPDIPDLYRPFEAAIEPAPNAFD